MKRSRQRFFDSFHIHPPFLTPFTAKDVPETARLDRSGKSYIINSLQFALRRSGRRSLQEVAR
jgi:hypothetical protein